MDAKLAFALLALAGLGLGAAVPPVPATNATVPDGFTVVPAASVPYVTPIDDGSTVNDWQYVCGSTGWPNHGTPDPGRCQKVIEAFVNHTSVLSSYTLSTGECIQSHESECSGAICNRGFGNLVANMADAAQGFDQLLQICVEGQQLDGSAHRSTLALSLYREDVEN